MIKEKMIVKDKNNNIYTIDRVIAEGGFGCVYQATREHDKKKFAVKTIKSNFSNNSIETSFKNELLLAEKIRGSNIIRYENIHNGNEYPELPPYIIMEYADGGTLREIIDERRTSKNPFVLKDLLKIYKQLISGMEKKNAKLVHRDIKPENILICNNIIKISDFGISKIVSENTRTITLKGYGSFRYIAPEAWDYDKNTIQMDIYSMGIIFYELATLKYPYDLKRNDYEGYKNAHKYYEIEDYKALEDATSPVIAATISKMLDKSLDHRYNNWKEIRNQFKNQSSEDPEFDEIVKSFISKINKADIKEQNIIEEKKAKELVKIDLRNFVNNQLKKTVIKSIERFVKGVKNIFPDIGINYCRNDIDHSDFFEFHLRRSTNKFITFICKVIHPNSFSRKLHFDRFLINNEEKYTPQFKNKNVIAWVEIKNHNKHGFNILLNEEKWYIFNNKNNPLAIVKREQPFAFSIDELEEALKGTIAAHITSSEVSSFADNTFCDIIGRLLSEY